MKKVFAIFMLLAALVFSAPAPAAETREGIMARVSLINAYREMFAAGDFAKLDQGLNRVQLEYEQGKRDEVDMTLLLTDTLDATDPAFEALYNKWVTAYPDSYAAHQARGKYFFRRAFGLIEEARKSAVVQTLAQMPHAGAETVKPLLEQALREATRAMGLAAKPLASYGDLIVIYGFLGDYAASRRMLDAANKLSPKNLGVRQRYMNMLYKSGGSAADFRKQVAEMRKSGIGRDEAGLFMVYHYKLLSEELYEELDREINAVQKDYESGKIGDQALEAYFDFLAGSNPETAAKFNAWVKAYPRSYAARAARAQYSLNNAWTARGDSFASDMTPQERAGLALYVKQAREDSTAAASLAAKPVMAYKIMVSIAQLQGTREEAETALRLATTADPKNSIVRFAYMYTLIPRWGGSMEAMENFLTQSKAAGIDIETIMHFERMILDEKFDASYHAGHSYPNLGQLVTGF